MSEIQFQSTGTEQLFDPVTQDNPKIDSRNPSSMAPVAFTSFGSKVLGTMFIAAGNELHPTVLLLGGFPGNEVNFDIAHAIRRQGLNVFTFYPRGSWGSEGNYSWQNIVDDAAEAVKFLKTSSIKEKYRIDSERIVFVGYSMGGFSALYNSIRLDEIKNVCAISPFNAGYFGSILNARAEVMQYSIEQMLPAMDFVNCKSTKELLNEFIVNQNEWNLLNHLDKLSKKNILMIGSKYDSIAPLELHHVPLHQNLSKINQNFQSLVLDTGHSYSDKRIELMKIISHWLNQIKF